MEKREAVQVASFYCAVVALANDGTLWLIWPEGDDKKWEQLPALPQDGYGLEKAKEAEDF